MYKNKKIPLYESVLLPLPSQGKERNDLSLDINSQLVLHARDGLYKGSWIKMLKDIEENKVNDAEKQRKVAISLMMIEDKYKINLGDLLRKWCPLE